MINQKLLVIKIVKSKSRSFLQPKKRFDYQCIGKNNCQNGGTDSYVKNIISKRGTKLRLIKIVESTRPEKKLMAVFEKNGRQKTVHFGAKNYSDYTIHGDLKRKKRYLKRHAKRENWNEPTSAGSLSRYILWGKKALKESIADYKRRFHFK